MKPYLVPLALSLIVPAHAAMLKTVTTLDGPRVYLRDLFADAGENANRLLGPGPAPGGRIVVEARQLRAIAREYDVDWRPVSSGDRAVLEWPGRPMRRDDVIAAARAALVARGAAPDCDVVIPGFTPPIVPLSGASAPVVSEVDYDADLGRFTGIVSVAVAGADPIVTRISGEVSDVVTVPVAMTRLRAGAIPGPDDIRMARVRVNTIHDEVARDPSAVIGRQLRLQLAPGVPIPVSQLMAPTEISRGDTVRLELRAGGLTVTGEGVALEAGAAGARIRVRNVSSGAVIEGIVVSPGMVRISPGSMPITAQARPGYAASGG